MIKTAQKTGKAPKWAREEVGWCSEKLSSGYYYNLSHQRTFRYGHSSLSGFLSDLPTLIQSAHSSHVLLIDIIAGGSHKKAFNRCGINDARILTDDTSRRYSIIPLPELEKLTSEYELCFTEWPDSARLEDIDCLGSWGQGNFFGPPLSRSARDLETPMSFLRRIGSSLLYFWYDGQDRHILEPEPRVAVRLFRRDLRACAQVSNPDSVFEPSDQQVVSLLAPESAYRLTGPRHIQIDKHAARVVVWNSVPGDRWRYRTILLRNGEVEISDEGEFAGAPSEFDSRGCLGSPSCLIALAIALGLLWLVCRRFF